MHNLWNKDFDKKSVEVAVLISPEEEEANQKEIELAGLQAKLLEEEESLDALKRELAHFEARYVQMVGKLYAKLDAVLAMIAALKADRAPDDTTVQERAEEARQRAEESARASADANEHQIEREPPSAELKSVYRELSKLIHPDLGPEQDRERRTELFKAAVNAKDSGDIETLIRMLEAEKGFQRNDNETSSISRLAMILQKLSQIVSRIGTIEVERKSLLDSEIWTLKLKAEAAEKEGKDLLAQMAADLETRLETARKELEILVSEGQQ